MFSKVPRVILPKYNTMHSPEASSEGQGLEIDGDPSSGDKRLRSKETEYGQGYAPRVKEQEDAAKLSRKYTQLLEDNDKLQKKFDRYMENTNRIIENAGEEALKLQETIHQLESEKSAIEEKHNIFIRKQQEDSFRQMTTSRWVPIEDSRVIGDLDRLKRNMRSWAKKAAVTSDMVAILRSLDSPANGALRHALERVVHIKDHTLPSGLYNSKKAPGLLLNALLSHSIYTNLFRYPFFFLEERIVEGQPSEPDYHIGLEEVYDQGLRCKWSEQWVEKENETNSGIANREDAHVWRSQTLRLLLPQMTADASKEEKELHEKTVEAIAKAADQQASSFLEGTARYLIANEARDKLYAIHREAATMSYTLWTRRTTLKCYTLRNMGHPNFDPDSKYWLSHSSVDYESHEDQLKGKPISVIVHPLLMVYGTDDAEDYDQGRVWAPAEVWLDSRDSSNK